MVESTTERSQPMKGLRPLYFYLIVALVFVCDQITKALIQRSMAFGEYRQILGPNVMLSLTQNTGGAWGILPSENRVFVAFAAVAIVALLFAYHRIARGDLLVGSAFALAMGGALGNLLDRLRYGYVVDFFAVRIVHYHWPIFNVADSAISFGIILLLLHYIRSFRAEANESGNSHVSTAAPNIAADDLTKKAHE